MATWPADHQSQGRAVLIPPVHKGSTPKLKDDDAAPPGGLPSRKELKQQLKELRTTLDGLQRRLYAESARTLLVVLQARDAGGKDGTIRRVFGGLNPQGCWVTSFGKPTERELRQDFLWRVHQAVPPSGKIGIFNRSHYEDVLVVRVRGLAKESVWSPRFDHINAFERILHENGVTILKFMLHISREEQRRRLLRRLEDPRRNWKFDPEDLDDRNRWDEYTRAYQDVLSRTSTPHAPWFVIPSDDKRTRDYLVAERVVQALVEMDPHFPRASESVKQFVDALR
jgi:PPK2 family polyphosphate:nucleotide phosphotransferase